MKLSVAVLTLGLTCAFGQASMANEAVGVWLTDEGKAKVRLSECGQGLCSEIVWLREGTDERGQPLRDLNNPDPRQRNRPIMGLEILQNLTPAGPGRWQGHIYNPENGKMYTAQVAVGGDRLMLKGCVSWGWPCGEQIWTRTNDAALGRKPAPAAAEMRQARAPEPRQQAAAPLPWASGRAAQPQRAAQPEAPAMAATTSALRAAPARREPAPAPQQVARASAAASAASPLATRPDGDDYIVQVAARQSENEALTAFSDLQRRFPDLLGTYQPLIQAADLGDKGVWYRVRVGPIDEKNSAAAFCERLKSAGGDCIVRRHE